MIKVLAVVLSLLLSSSLALAEMYQWVDEKGVVTFKDTPPPSSKKRKKVKVYSDYDFAPAPPSQPATAGKAGTSAARSPSRAPSQAASPKRFTGTVELYITSWCGYCKKAESYLKSNGIPYVTYDIEKDSEASRRHKELGGRGVPLIIIGSNKMNGFSQENLEYYLNNSR